MTPFNNTADDGIATITLSCNFDLCLFSPHFPFIFLSFNLTHDLHLPGNVLHDIRQGDSYRNKKDELELLGIKFYTHKQPRGRQNQHQHQHESQASRESQSQHQLEHQLQPLTISNLVTDDSPAHSHDNDDILTPHTSLSTHPTSHKNNAVSQSFSTFLDDIVSLV